MLLCQAVSPMSDALAQDATETPAATETDAADAAEPASGESLSEDPATDDPATADPATDEPAAEMNAPADADTGTNTGTKTDTDADPGADAGAGDDTEDDPADDPTADDPTADDPGETPAGGDAGGNAAGANGGNAAGANGDDAAGGVNWGLALLILAAIVLPVVVGNTLGAKLGMPDHGWKIATILTTFTAAGLAIGLGEFKLGPDLAGGTTLIYELEDVTQIVDDADDPEQAPAEGEKAQRRKVSLQQMCDAIKQRIDPAGQKEMTIRPYGKAIEIIIPKLASDDDKDYVKRQITDLGQLEFRITADRRWPEDRDLIELAEKAPVAQKTIMRGDTAVARWVPFKEEEFATDLELVKREAGKRDEALVLLDIYNVTGEYLTNASKSFDVEGPIVQFSFNSKGATRFGLLTGNNLPRSSDNRQKRRLGILLNNELFSAPTINSVIRANGQISGRSMTEEDVDYTISILNAGSLPAALNPTPLSEETVSPTLGAATIEKAKYAITVSLIAVLAFMALYYRFAGIVACMALLANLLLVLGIMVFLDAAFTLPGLAGLVLTVGMSVDANVLIFERIREELNRGAALRMAIRNGFGRATTTIIDANITTLIAGVVLYSVGKDNIKGFAVTLILGILMSMFTAIFCSRVLFDIAERRKWISTLKFASIVGSTNFNFIGKRGVAVVCSAIIIAIGLTAVAGRKSQILNIDFTGGTSVTMVLNDDDKMTFGEVDKKLRETVLVEKDLLVVEQGTTNTRYTINSNLAAGDEPEKPGEERDLVKETEQIIADAFAGKLMTYNVDVGDATEFSEGDYSGATVDLKFNQGAEYSQSDGLAHDALAARITQIVRDLGHNTEPLLVNPAYNEGSSQRFKDWTLRLGGLNAEQARSVAQQLEADLEALPIFPLANKIGGKVAGNMQWLALRAIVLSLIGIIGYIWFRFQNVSFGLAAVVALVHDVLVTLGAIAVSAYVVTLVPPLAQALQIDSFQISLPILAAFLTIIGYSLNDTIVVFDRIREVRGKSPNLTAEMINTSINQTLARTLLTSITTLIVVGILYFFGGAGIHGFAFALVVGVFVGTYSSIFIASPALLAMVGSKVDVGVKQADKTSGAA